MDKHSVEIFYVLLFYKLHQKMKRLFGFNKILEAFTLAHVEIAKMIFLVKIFIMFKI